MKILIYGFGPYKRWRDNITVKVLSLLKDRENLRSKIFDVKFDEDMFLDEVRSLYPEFILGMGQHPRARKIRIERTAVNRKRNSKNEKSEAIHPLGPDKIYMNLKLSPGTDTRITYDAGEYVCNFSMYVIGSYAKKKGIKSAFLHIPMKMDPSLAAAIVDEIIDNFE